MIKLIIALSIGVILTACVGAVNLAEGVNGVDSEAALINRCIMDDHARDITCESIVSKYPCILDPFGATCDITFSGYHTTARDNRVAFCNNSENTNTSSLCTDSESIKDICEYDVFSMVCNSGYDGMRETTCADEPSSPRCETTISRVCGSNAFDGLCDDNLIYESVRLDDCITAGNASEPRCTGAFATEPCVLNPFGTNCDTGNYIDGRANRLAYCRDNNDPNLCTKAISITCAISGNIFDPLCKDSQHKILQTQHINFCATRENKNNPTCAVALSRPNIASFLQSFTTELPTTPNAETPQNEFLQGTVTGLNFGNIKNSEGNNPTVTNLTLASKNLGGDSADGMAFFVGKVGGNSYSYAGILSGTDLGERIAETEGTAMWNGRFITSYQINEIKDFMLTINFGAGDEAGQIESFVSYGDSIHYSLTGDFDSSGVITGSVEYTNDTFMSDGTLHGLIGQEGAVGFFIADKIQGVVPYVGGFVARPPAE